MERIALYNSLRINWQNNPRLNVKPWQVENYRKLSYDQLFKGLEKFGVVLDKPFFLSLSEQVPSPEEFVEHLLADNEESGELYDQIYLLVFELWRRLVPEKQTLGLFCDELDHQIESFDRGDLAHFLEIEEAIDQLETILEDNASEESTPQDLFHSIQENSAHDVESFLYDFIEMQIENGNPGYAEDLVETFLPYVEEPCWLNFLALKITSGKDLNEAEKLLHALIKEAIEKKDLELIFTLLFHLAQTGALKEFQELVKTAVPLLKTEEDFQDLVEACIDFAHFKDADAEEKELKQLLESRKQRNKAALFLARDEGMALLTPLIKKL
ncbi:MAG: hypothetical protein ACK5MA_01640 [Parachlamydiaceae bacterium]